jgi:hypothetical protein
MEDYFDAPIVPRAQALENSRIMGDYYRNLAVNYDDYTRGIAPWPYQPTLN